MPLSVETETSKVQKLSCLRRAQNSSIALKDFVVLIGNLG